MQMGTDIIVRIPVRVRLYVVVPLCAQTAVKAHRLSRIAMHRFMVQLCERWQRSASCDTTRAFRLQLQPRLVGKSANEGRVNTQLQKTVKLIYSSEMLLSA